VSRNLMYAMRMRKQAYMRIECVRTRINTKHINCYDFIDANCFTLFLGCFLQWLMVFYNYNFTVFLVSDAGIQYYWLSCWATSPSRVGKVKKILTKRPGHACMETHVSDVRADMVCGRKTMMIIYNILIAIYDV